MQLFWDWVRSNRAGYTGTSGLTLTGDVKGTGLVPGTLTSTLGTTGVAAGTYGGANVIPAFTVDAKGRLLTATNAGTAGASIAIGTFTGAVEGTGTFPGGPVGMSFTANPAFAGTGTTVGWHATGTSTGAMFSWGTATGGYIAAGTGSAALLQGINLNLSGTGTAAGLRVTGLGTAARFAVSLGSSTTQGATPALGQTNLTPVTGSATSFTLMAGTIPANALIAAGQGVRIQAWGTFPSFVPNRWGFVFGGGTVVSTGTSAANTWRMEATVMAMSDTSQRYVCRFDLSGSTYSNQVTVGTLAVTASANIVHSIAGTNATAQNFVQQALIVEHLNN